MTIIYIVTSTKKEAKRIASFLLKKKLIACANWWPTDSVYHWQGKIVNNKEVILICKTVKKNYKQVEREVKKLHSYKVPCICAWETSQVDKKYFEWVKEEID